MRVLVAADAMAGVGPQQASEIIAQAFADAGAQVAVVSLADGGPWFPAAVAAFDADASVAQPESIQDVLAALTPGDARLYVDLTGVSPHTWDELTQVDRGRVDELRLSLAGRDLVAVVRSGGEHATLTGLTGRVAERGRLSGEHLSDTLANNDRVSAWLTAQGLDGDAAGAGAADGIGAIILALGGRISSGIDVCVSGFDVAATVERADLAVTGSALLDFHAVGGDVVKAVAKLANDALRPVVAIVGRNFVSSRELRLAGIESAHSVLDGAGEDQATGEQVGRVAVKVARSWIR